MSVHSNGAVNHSASNNNGQRFATLYRDLDTAGEREIEFLIRFKKGQRPLREYIDPAEHVHHAVGQPMSRDGCVVSFATGMAHVYGHVLIHYRDEGKVVYTERIDSRADCVVPEYFLLGIMWGRGCYEEWDRVVRGPLHRIKLSTRARKWFLRYNAIHCITHAREWAKGRVGMKNPRTQQFMSPLTDYEKSVEMHMRMEPGAQQRRR